VFRFLRVFGIGRVPPRDRALFESEGIVVIDEALTGSITYRNYRAPGRYSNWKKQGFLGSVVLTERRIVAYAFAMRVIDLPLDHPRIADLHCETDGSRRLTLSMDAAKFHADQSGSVVYSCSTAHAWELRDRLIRAGASDGPPAD
jgi:hypothetical protein